jgi:hypothetical protein
MRRPIHSQDRWRNVVTHPSLESMNDSRPPHRSRRRNSLTQDHAPLMPRQKPQSRQRESMSLLRSRDAHARAPLHKTGMLSSSLRRSAWRHATSTWNHQPTSPGLSPASQGRSTPVVSVASPTARSLLDSDEPASVIGLQARQTASKRGAHERG